MKLLRHNYQGMRSLAQIQKDNGIIKAWIGSENGMGTQQHQDLFDLTDWVVAARSILAQDLEDCTCTTHEASDGMECSSCLQRGRLLKVIT